MEKRNTGTPRWVTKDIDVLLKGVLKLRDLQECRKFFRDILTPQELKTFAMRLKVAHMLDSGATYEEIEKKTGMSSTTIARINRWLSYGEGGYKLILKRLSNYKQAE